MPAKIVSVDNEYKKDTKLKPEDIASIQEWMSVQPHLPDITDLQTIFFLQSCYYSNELAKQTIDIFYNVRALCPEFFSNIDPRSKEVQKSMDVVLHLPLAKKTPEGYKVFFSKLVNSDPSVFHFPSNLKLWDMMCMLHLAEEGTSVGHVIAMDFNGVVFGHLAKLGILNFKKFLYYLQEAMPIRLKAMHFFNTVPFMDKILALMKPFMKKELIDVLYLHENVESLSKFIPIECLPADYGGSMDHMSKLHDEAKQKLTENYEFFLKEELQIADESKRPGKPKSINEVFGVEGTFKKLDID